MRSRPKSAKSQFQINFETKQIFQRNKKFIDFDTNPMEQSSNTPVKRKPFKTEDNHISDKINASFMNNTTLEQTQRNQKTSFKYKSKPSFHLDLPSDLQASRQIRGFSESPRKVSRGRSFSIEKMTSREYHHNLKNKPISDERRFHNFEQFSPSVPLYCEYNRMLPQSTRQIPLKPFIDINYETQKLYEEIYYKRTINSTKVDYKSQGKLKSERIFFKERKLSDTPATALKSQRVDHGIKVTTVCRDTPMNSGNINEFYRNSGRELPSQSEMRFMNQLTNHWKDESGSIKRKKLDYETKKMKSDMADRRLRKVKESKIGHFEKGEVCDLKYYARLKDRC